IDDFITSQTLLGEEITNLPTNTATTLLGEEERTRIFDKDFKVKRETINYYHFDNATNIESRSYAIRTKYSSAWVFLYDVPTNWVNVFDAFDITLYRHISSWIQLDSTVTFSYEGNNLLKQKTSYTYGTNINVQPHSITTIDSKGQALRAENKYSTDLSASGNVYEKLKNSN